MILKGLNKYIIAEMVLIPNHDDKQKNTFYVEMIHSET
jgi:hypothetical protein